MNDHLKKISMTYLQHFLFAIGLAIECIVMCVILMIHSIFPSILTNNFSEWIHTCHERVNRR